MRLRVALLWVCAVGTSYAGEPQPEFSFGVVPQQSTVELARDWAPILKYLEARTGFKLSFRTAPNIPEFERRVADGDYAFAYMNPYHYTVFSRSPGYRAFARQKDKRIRGLLVVSRDSSIQRLEDLKDTTIAFPAPNAFAASLLPRAQLRQLDIPFTPIYVSSHDSVYRAVALGLYPAGGGIERTLGTIDPDVRARLRVLWRTPGYTAHALAARADIATGVVAALQQAMIAMSDSAEGAALLDGIGFAGIEAAKDSDWDDVRALNIDTLDALVGGR
ncbi:MAG: phosphate/phosphite/phosphonate ABC transporter substrate-binding protein [Gammaproteobacteria bacterium]|nr:phosphate/phosphite/phosphonate ABC transporter substrate-binding protein [Gammaproteobacteria bacterium]MCP5137087.1 phosphate/phosphite/phosphonate ABC transporter substrate-binding protein [Gammaproteobacteria bacterium]